VLMVMDDEMHSLWVGGHVAFEVISEWRSGWLDLVF